MQLSCEGRPIRQLKEGKSSTTQANVVVEHSYLDRTKKGKMKITRHEDECVSEAPSDLQQDGLAEGLARRQEEDNMAFESRQSNFDAGSSSVPSRQEPQSHASLAQLDPHKNSAGPLESETGPILQCSENRNEMNANAEHQGIHQGLNNIANPVDPFHWKSRATDVHNTDLQSAESDTVPGSGLSSFQCASSRGSDMPARASTDMLSAGEVSDDELSIGSFTSHSSVKGLMHHHQDSQPPGYKTSNNKASKNSKHNASDSEPQGKPTSSPKQNNASAESARTSRSNSDLAEVPLQHNGFGYTKNGTALSNGSPIPDRTSALSNGNHIPDRASPPHLGAPYTGWNSGFDEDAASLIRERK